MNMSSWIFTVDEEIGNMLAKCQRKPSKGETSGYW